MCFTSRVGFGLKGRPTPQQGLADTQEEQCQGMKMGELWGQAQSRFTWLSLSFLSCKTKITTSLEFLRNQVA